MKWSELKEEIDKQLKMHGNEDPRVFVIDISGFGADGKAEDIHVTITKEGTLFVGC